MNKADVKKVIQLNFFAIAAAISIGEKQNQFYKLFDNPEDYKKTIKPYQTIIKGYAKAEEKHIPFWIRDNKSRRKRYG